MFRIKVGVAMVAVCAVTAGTLVGARFETQAPPQTLDFTSSLRVLDVSSGWYVNVERQAVGYDNLAPIIVFKLQNVSGLSLGRLEMHVVFRRVNEQKIWNSSFFTVAECGMLVGDLKQHFAPRVGPNLICANGGGRSGSEGLSPGATTPILVAMSVQGYSRAEWRAEMLQDTQFVDAKVELLATYNRSAQWTRLNEFPITRRLVTVSGGILFEKR